ncbi:MAG: PTS transporter subunit EIIC [Coprobacillus sp.]
MNKFMEILEKYLMPISNKMTSNKVLVAIKDAFILSMPFTVVGSLSGLINSQGKYWAEQFGISLDGILGHIINVCGNVNAVAMGLIGVVIVLSSSYFYADQVKRDNPHCVPLVASIIALVAYMATVPGTLTFGKETVNAYTINFFNYEGMFTGLVIGLLTAVMYNKLIKSNFTIKLPGSVPPGIFNSFKSIIPFFLILMTFSIVKEVVEAFGFASLQVLFAQFIITPLKGVGTGLPAVIIVIILMQLLWFFGIHGFSIMWGLISVLWMPIFMEHIQLYLEAGSFDVIKEVAPNTLSNVYAMIGGSGSTLALVVLLLFVAKKGSPERTVGKLSLIPGLFGINEPLTFGLPIVLNPIMFFPFVFVPVVNAIIGYFATSSGLVNPLVVLNSGAEPIFVNAWVLGAFTLSPVILCVVLFFLDMAMYYPFVKLQLKANKSKVEDTIDIQGA